MLNPSRSIWIKALGTLQVSFLFFRVWANGLSPPPESKACMPFFVSDSMLQVRTSCTRVPKAKCDDIFAQNK
ncbi:hypothetical protein BD779DRAFT_1507275 [Infundibulicybe gibba]|nr:hypothetical protein BD779DRAFT_1507275 [Infundibulicybe gibba]